MKLNIYYMIISALLCISSLSNYGSSSSPFSIKSESSRDATPGRWNVEIYNKNSQPMLFTLSGVYNNRLYNLTTKKLASGEKIRFEIVGPLIKSYRLYAWVGSSKVSKIKFLMDENPEDLDEEEKNELSTPQVKAIIDNSQQKTIYLTFDQNNIFRPQTGKLAGLLGKTDSGLSLRNNISQKNVVNGADFK